MKCNINSKERGVRVVAALVSAALGFFISPWFYIITVLALIVAISGFCPALPKERCDGGDCCGGSHADHGHEPVAKQVSEEEATEEVVAQEEDHNENTKEERN